MSREITHDGAGGLRVRFPFDRRLVELVKSLPRRRWQAADKTWWVPEDDIVDLVDALGPEGFGLDETSRRLYADRGGTRAPAAIAAHGAPRPGGGRGLFDDPPAADTEAPVAEAPEHYTVGRLNREVAAVLERAFPAPIWLAGEISGFNRNRHKRHVSFTLLERDPAGEAAFQVAAVLFEEVRREIEKKLAAAGAPFALEDEIDVRVRARIDLYDAWGAYRVVIEDMDLAYTLGEAARRREEIVRKLGAEGLLERNTSLPFPDLPLRVGLITSLGSDAYHDVLRTLSESRFAFEVTAHGARVQGRSTESSVLNALDWFRARLSGFDVVVICRGGGSRTDLAWFDTEPLGRAVAMFPIPVVVGIGHEQDVSVLDHVGWRAKTPTAAAGLLVERVGDSVDRVESLARSIFDGGRALLEAEVAGRRDTARRLARAVRAFLDVEKVEIRRRREHLVKAAARGLQGTRVALLAGARQLGQAARRDLAAERRRVREAAAGLLPRVNRAVGREAERLEARARRAYLVDPRRVVERGYAILRRSEGTVVVDAGAVPPGAKMTAELRTGKLDVVAAARANGPAGKDGR